MPKKLFSLAVIFTSSLVLVACGPKAPDPELNLNDESVDYFSTTSDAQLDLNNLENQQSDPNLQNQQGEPMRTLEDFETIEASQVTLQTTKGEITFDIFSDKVPLTAQNFLNLAKDGYFDGMVFHRVIEDFMAQVGDPLTKEEGKEAMWGSGGPGYTIADEFDPSLRHDGAGVVSMANRGPNTGGSQFFITYEATPWLDDKHAIFGKVTSGMEVLEQIEVGDKIEKVTFN